MRLDLSISLPALSSLGARGAFAGILLSGTASIPDNTTSGSTVGTLSVVGGSGTYTFTLTSNPGAHFSISAALLKTSGTLTAGSYPITVHADNGAGSTFDRNFSITVTLTGGAFVLQADFSAAANEPWGFW